MRGTTTSRASARLTGWAVIWALMLSTFGLVATPAYAAAAPTGLKATAIATKAVALSWDAVPGATGYRVRISKSSKMTSPKTWDVVGTSFEWTHTDPNPGHTSARLSAKTTYYFQVKAIALDKADITGYSKAVAVKTANSSKTTELAPVNVKATTAGPTSLYLSWSSRGPGVVYRVRYTTDPSKAVTKWPYVDFSSAGGTLTGLKAKKTYYVRLRVINTKKAALSNYTKRISATTPASTKSPGLVVVSYNVLKAGVTPSWDGRRKLVATNIKDQKPDVLALQEATGTKVTSKKIPQYTDVLTLVGSKYKYVTTKGSAGTRLAYNSDRLSLVKGDAVKLSTLGASQRYAVWAILQDKQSNKKLFVINTHLEPGSNTSAEFNDARIKQAEEVLALIAANNPSNLPVVVTGDMNSSRATKPSNGAYATFTAGGLVDPLGNADATWVPETPTAEHVIDAAYNTFNNRERLARRTAWPIGTRVDYILVSKNIRVAQTRNVIKLDTARKYVGTFPSDHNLITAAIHLP